MTDIDLMPGALIAAPLTAAVALAYLARTAKTATRRFRLHTLKTGVNAITVAASIAAVISEGGAGWVAVAVLAGINLLFSAVRVQMAYEEAAMDAAEADAAARPPRPLEQMTPLDYTPTKETNR